jgi:hypothetical protein
LVFEVATGKYVDQPSIRDEEVKKEILLSG